MPSSSMSEPCSIERTPARIATLMPSVPWACAATYAPFAAASSTAARTSGSASSTAPESVPRVRTAPVTMHLMTLAPPATRARTFVADLVGVADDPEAQRVRQPHRRRLAGHLATAAGARDVGAGALHPRARRPAGLDGVAQRDVDERPERPDVAHGREPGAQRVPRVADPAHRLLGGRRVDRRDPRVLEVADQVAVAVDEPRHDPVRHRADRASRRRVPVHPGARIASMRSSRHEDPAVVEPAAGRDVEQVGRRDRVGAGGIGRIARSVAGGLPCGHDHHRSTAIHRR